MNCPKCGTPAPAGAAHCKRCGTALAAKSPKAAAPEPSSSDEIDLLPMEPPKASSYSAYEPPPGLDIGPPAPGAPALPGPGGPPGGPPSDAPVKKIRGAMAAPKKLPINTIIGGVLGFLLLCWVGWLVFRTKNEVKVGKPKVEKVYLVNPNQTYVENIEVTGLVPYTLDLDVLDGEVLVGIAKRNPKDPTNLAAVKKLDEPLEAMKKGDKRTLTGEFKHKEQWSWILANDAKKPARVKVKFQTQQ